MEIRTHQQINHALCGVPVEVGEGSSLVRLSVDDQMAVDGLGLIHGGFVFGLADYAAMIAVNHPNVVLGAAEVRLLKPVKTGDVIQAEATVVSEQGKKRMVEVTVKRDDQAVLTGTFTCFVLDTHVLA
jgi:uncharacterized protein (TIGR00369 family)